jgi:hypothetical protein
MRDTLEIGSTPHNEVCVPVSETVDYIPAMRAECERFKKLLEQAYPPVGDAYLFIKSNSHEFGTYLEVAVRFEDDIKEEREYAFMLESKAPGTWEELERLAREAAPQVVGEDPRD